MEIDVDRLKKDLKDYYGTAMVNVSPLAMIDLSKIDNMSLDELVEMAQSIGLDIEEYIEGNHYIRRF